MLFKGYENFSYNILLFHPKYEYVSKNIEMSSFLDVILTLFKSYKNVFIYF